MMARGESHLVDYTVHDLVGCGSTSQVQLARRVGDQHEFAIKTMKRVKKCLKRSSNSQSSQEVDIMRMLDHPNIVKLEAVQEETNRVRIVMEYLSGGESMNALPQQTPLPMRMAKRYFIDALSGLEYLHQNSVAHLDIKPQNMLVGAEGRLRLIDFGTSRILQTQEDLIVGSKGTPMFCAPECCEIEAMPYAPRPVDVWALGASLHQFITGSVPFNAENRAELIRRIKNEDFTADIEPDLRHLLHRMMCKAPEDRITIEGIRSHPWMMATENNIMETMLQKNAKLPSEPHEIQTTPDRTTAGTFDTQNDNRNQARANGSRRRRLSGSITTTRSRRYILLDGEGADDNDYYRNINNDQQQTEGHKETCSSETSLFLSRGLNFIMNQIVTSTLNL